MVKPNIAITERMKKMAVRRDLENVKKWAMAGDEQIIIIRSNWSAC